MTPRFFLTGILFLATSLGLAALDKETVKKEDPQPRPAAEKETKRPRRAAPGEVTCSLHVTWWEEPPMAEGERLELAIQVDKTTTPFMAGQMQIGPAVEYVGPSAVTIVRKVKTQVEALDKKGKPVVKIVEDWVPLPPA